VVVHLVLKNKDSHGKKYSRAYNYLVSNNYIASYLHITNYLIKLLCMFNSFYYIIMNFMYKYMCLSSSRQCVQVSSGHPGSSTAMVSATK